jgi:hypothetical protein
MKQQMRQILHSIRPLRVHIYLMTDSKQYDGGYQYGEALGDFRCHFHEVQSYQQRLGTALIPGIMTDPSNDKRQ